MNVLGKGHVSDVAFRVVPNVVPYSRSCLLQLPLSMSASTAETVSRPAVTTLSLVAFSQMTPLVLALRFALSVSAVERLTKLTVELLCCRTHGSSGIRDPTRVCKAHGRGRCWLVSR